MMQRIRTLQLQAFVLPLIVAFIGAVLSSPVALAQSGTLKIKVIDAESGKVVPARLEVQAADGKHIVAADALPYMRKVMRPLDRS